LELILSGPPGLCEKDEHWRNHFNREPKGTIWSPVISIEWERVNCEHPTRGAAGKTPVWTCEVAGAAGVQPLGVAGRDDGCDRSKSTPRCLSGKRGNMKICHYSRTDKH